MTSFLRYLNTAPAPDSVIKALICGPLAGFDAKSGSIFVYIDDGLAIVADYASPRNLLARYHTLPLSVDIPYTRAFLTGETLVTARRNIFSEFPALMIDADLWESGEIDSTSLELVSVPISSQGVSIGAFGFISDRTHDWGPSDFALLDALAAVLGLWLTHPSSCIGTRLTEPVTTDHDGGLQLSTRQHAVLRLLAQDKTNDSIAATLGVSVSTVKQDVQRLLRAMRSPDRKVAVQHAIALGILQPNGWAPHARASVS